MMRNLGPTSKNGSWREVTFDNAMQMLMEHRGPEDSPAPNTTHGYVVCLNDVIEKLMDERKLYQFTIEWMPEWLQKIKGANLPEAPEGWVSASHMSFVTGISLRTVKENFSDFFKGIKSKNNEWYANPNERLDYWITDLPHPPSVYRRLILISEILHDNEDIRTNAEIYKEVEKLEREYHIIKYGLYYDYPVEKFFERNLKVVPSGTVEWAKVIDHLSGKAWEARESYYQGTYNKEPI